MGNQNGKEILRERSHSFESVANENLNGYGAETEKESGEQGYNKEKDFRNGKRRSKSDLDLARVNSPDDTPLRDIVIKMPRKKKQLEKIITTQAIEIRGKDEIISEGKKYVMRALDENERCVERIEERDQIIEDKENVIRAMSEKVDSLTERLEGNILELGEKEKCLEKANEQHLRLQNHLVEQENIVKEMQVALDRQNRVKEKNQTKEKGTDDYEKRFEINALKRENDRLKSQVTEKENIIEGGRKYVDRLSSEKERFQQQLREKERECLEKQYIIDRMKRETERDKIQIRQKEMEADGKGKALERTEIDLRSVRNQLRENDVTLAEKERALERAERLRSEATETVQDLERQLGEERTTNQNSIGRLREEKRVTDERLRRAESEQQNQQRTLQSLEAERNRAKQSADILRKDQPWMITKAEITLTEKVLGTGAWGRVLEGNFRGMKVAVKEIHEIIQSAHNRLMFDREITFATLVRHPCILQFLGVADYRSNNPLLVTELMDMSLAGLLTRERVLGKRYVTTLALDIAYGVNYLHCFRPHPIIHRDLNPGNVMVWRQGDVWRAKLCDFGSAEFMSGRMSLNPGNPFYSAPEVDTPRQTPKVDVYSYGVLLCELCTSKTPNPQDRKRQIGLVWNADLKIHIERCAHEEPENRPTMAEIIEMLTSLEK